MVAPIFHEDFSQIQLVTSIMAGDPTNSHRNWLEIQIYNQPIRPRVTSKYLWFSQVMGVTPNHPVVNPYRIGPRWCVEEEECSLRSHGRLSRARLAFLASPAGPAAFEVTETRLRSVEILSYQDTIGCDVVNSIAINSLFIGDGPYHPCVSILGVYDWVCNMDGI